MNTTVSIIGLGWLGLPLAWYLKDHQFAVKGSTTRHDKLVDLNQAGLEAALFHLDQADQIPSTLLEAEVVIINIPSKDIQAFRTIRDRIANTQVAKVIFVSSTSVYDATDSTVDENTPTNDSPLIEIENLFLESDSFETTVIRFSGLFGRERKPGNWFQGRKVPNPQGFVNMIHLDDCIGIIHQVLVKDIWNEVFNASGDSHPTREDFYTEARKVIDGAPPQFDHEIKPYKKVSNDKLKTVLGYRFMAPDVIEALRRDS